MSDINAFIESSEEFALAAAPRPSDEKVSYIQPKLHPTEEAKLSYEDIAIPPPNPDGSLVNSFPIDKESRIPRPKDFGRRDNVEGTESKIPLSQSIKDSIVRNSFIGNSLRVMDQTLAELERNKIDQLAIWDDRERLLYGVSEVYWEDILSAPTYALAERESERIRGAEGRRLRQQKQTFGKSLVADMVGFVVDPSNFIPGYGMLKGVQYASRMRALTDVGAGFARSTRGAQIAALAAAGGFEEAIRMSPRYISDPTFEVNEYMTDIAMSAAMSGLLPVAFSGLKKGVLGLPNAASDVRAHLHEWGADVGARQVLRFPGELRRAGIRNPGEAVQRSRAAAQDAVNRNFHEANARQNTRQFRNAVDEDLSADVPDVQNVGGFFDNYFRRVGDRAEETLKLRAKIARNVSVAGIAGGVVAGPVGAVVGAGLMSNKEYLIVAARLAKNLRKQRRHEYDRALATGDTRRAISIIRAARTKRAVDGVVDSREIVADQITTAVHTARQSIREIVSTARGVC